MNAEPDAEIPGEAAIGKGLQPDADPSGVASHDDLSPAADADADPDVAGTVRPKPRDSPRIHPDVSEDDRDVGWGEAPRPAGRDDDWYLRERPPHHG